MRVIYVRLFVFVAQGIDMADAFTGKFAVFVGIVLDMGVNVMRDRIEAVGCGIGKFGGADLFECIPPANCARTALFSSRSRSRRARTMLVSFGFCTSRLTPRSGVLDAILSGL